MAPPKMVVMGTPQFNPEFFLYDFLFVYGAAFKPQLANERLRACDAQRQRRCHSESSEVDPHRSYLEELESYKDAPGTTRHPTSRC